MVVRGSISGGVPVGVGADILIGDYAAVAYWS